MISFMEEIASWFYLNLNKYSINIQIINYLDIFLINFFSFSHIAKYNMLRIIRENGEFIRDPIWVFSLLIFEDLSQILFLITCYKLSMIYNLSQRSIAWNDISFYNFLQVFKILSMNFKFVSY